MSEAGNRPVGDRRGAGFDGAGSDGAGFDVDGTRVSFGGASADHGDLLESYAAVLRSVRKAGTGGALQLRVHDLRALASAVGADGHDVEIRIRALLGCTAAEARSIHKELIRRRLLQPVAALAVGTAIIWGPAAAAQGDRPRLGPGVGSTSPAAATTAEMGPETQMTAPDNIGAPTPTTTTSAAAEIMTPAALPGEQVEPDASTTAAVAPNYTATSPTTAVERSEEQPDVGIPEGETPTIIIQGTSQGIIQGATQG